MIHAGDIPQVTGDMDLLAIFAGGIREDGAGFGRTGASVHRTWQGLSGCYHAPERGDLMSATHLVSTSAATVQADAATVASALSTYAATMAPIKAELARLKREAVTLAGEINAYADGDHDKIGYADGPHGPVAVHSTSTDWHDDKDLVSRSNSLNSQVNAQVAAWQAAERACANAINATYGGTQYVVSDDDGRQAPNEYGFSAATYDEAAKQGQDLPWGSHEWGTPSDADIARGLFVDGPWNMLKGTGMLAWNATGLGGGDNFKATWSGLGALVNVTDFSSMGHAWGGVWDGMIAADQPDPGRRGGEIMFNFLTLPLGFTKVGKLGLVGKAGDLSKARAFAAVGAFARGASRARATVGETVNALKMRLPTLTIPKVEVLWATTPEGGRVFAGFHITKNGSHDGTMHMEGGHGGGPPRRVPEMGSTDGGPGHWVGVNRDHRPAHEYQLERLGLDRYPDGSMPEYEVNGVKFDGYHDGTLFDVKHRYDKVLGAPFGDGIRQDFLDEARKQVTAAQGHPIVWEMFEKDAADAVRELFTRNRIFGIKVVVAK